MKILITGASGLVGGALIEKLEKAGHEIFQVSRSEAKSDHDIQWNAYEGFAASEAAKLEGMDVCVHLAGESVASGSWTEEKKTRIRNSRLIGTKTLVEALSKTDDPPEIFIGASAVGYYGDRGNEIITEESDAGTGFLADISIAWEAETMKASKFASRVAIPRIGIVLSKEGGALEKMLTPFQYGLGGTIGSGEQWMPWIAIDDLVNVLVYAIENDEIEGPFNATSPNPVRNKDFTSSLANVVNRPAFIPIPGFGIKLILGEMGETLLLEGARVIPRKLEQKGFRFEFPELEDALRHVINA